MDNRFLTMDGYLRQQTGKPGECEPGQLNGGSVGLANQSPAIASSLSGDWALTMSAQQRALVILIENGGIDLGIPTIVDKLLEALPGASVIPASLRKLLVDQLRTKIKSFTDDLLETAELSLNRYAAAKPDFFGDVIVLRDGTATYADLKSTLVRLSQNQKIVDLLILTHGNKGHISASDMIDGDMIRAIKTENGKPLSIRSVYMMNCVGASLNQAWLDAGAKVSSGAKENNYIPEPSTFFFWQNWKNGQGFDTAVFSAYRKTINLMNVTLRALVAELPFPGTALLARGIDFADFDFVKSSLPVVMGRGNVTIKTDDLTFSQSMGKSLATTLVNVDALSLLSNAASNGSGPAITISDAGVQSIKAYEGFREHMYNDPVGHCTIGYGTLLHRGNCDGQPSEQPYLGGISQAEATKLLAQEAAKIQQVINSGVTVPLNQNQNDALVSFAYNVGTGNFTRSTLLKQLNQSHYDEVPKELRKWTKARQNGTLVDLPGLVKRRNGEAELFQRPSAPPPVSTQNSLAMTHSYRYYSPSQLVTEESIYSFAQNPVPFVIAGMEIGDALQVGLAAVAIAQTQVSASSGSLTLFYDKASRLLTPEARAQMPGSQTAKQSYSRQLLYLGFDRPLISLASAHIIIEWEGNPYGEIGTPVIRKNLGTSTDWSKSSASITISRLDRIPVPKSDPRTWPVVYSYEGNYDPMGNGLYEFSGEFEINAFGGLKFVRHEVVSRSLADWAISGKPEEFVVKGKDVIVPVPAVPQEQIDYLRTKLP